MITIQVCQDNENHTLIKQMPGALIQPDGRIKFKSPKGEGYIVCGDAAKALGIDPAAAVFDDAADSVHYRIDVPMYGKVVRVLERQAVSKLKLNPEWKRYNDVQNEGGEGYVPSSIPKYI